DQIIFTGGGTEADNLAVQGVAMARFLTKKPQRVLLSAIEHAAVAKAAEALQDFGIEVRKIPVGPDAQIITKQLDSLLVPETSLVSVHQVNNIVGAILPVEKLAEQVKKKVPEAVFHTDSIQAFGKIPAPTRPSTVDLISISAHKIGGP